MGPPMTVSDSVDVAAGPEEIRAPVADPAQMPRWSLFSDVQRRAIATTLRNLKSDLAGSR